MPGRIKMNVAPDRDNYRLLGNAWRDRANNVTAVSAKVGQTGKPLSNEERARHQSKILEARCDAFLNALHTPTTRGTKTLVDFGRMHLQVPRLSLRDLRILPGDPASGEGRVSSIAENNALSKLKGDFARFDRDVREAFLQNVRDKCSNAPCDPLSSSNNHIHGSLHKLVGELEQIHQASSGSAERERKSFENLFSRTRVADLETLAEREKALKKDKERKKDGAEQLYGPLKDVYTHMKLRAVHREMTALNDPSSYERHMATHRKKVSNHPLAAMELRDRECKKAGFGAASRISAWPEEPRETEKDFERFTEAKFKALAQAIRAFQAALSPASPEELRAPAQKALHEALHPILCSEERVAVHRFVHDMIRQLKRAGVSPEEIASLRQLLPEPPGSSLRFMQSVVRGTGKQMRLQDESIRMEKAFLEVLKLAAPRKDMLRSNLMSFDLDGVQALLTDAEQAASSFSDVSRAFLRSSAGAAYVRKLIEHGEVQLGQDANEITVVKRAGRKPDQQLAALRGLVAAIGKKCDLPPHEVFALVAQENAHLFMMTSDTGFWETESVSKLQTRLDGDDSPSRIFKQMHMRAAALGMKEEEVRPYMAQGIAHTLRNRSMVIQGTIGGGIAGAGAANAASTPVSAAVLPVAPYLALPGVLDAALMPLGWGLGAAAGAIVGRTLLREMEKKRVEEAISYVKSAPDVPLPVSTGYTPVHPTAAMRHAIGVSSFPVGSRR